MELERYATGGDMLSEEICYWMGYVAGEDAMLKKLSSQRRGSSQRRYLARGGI